MFNQRHLSLVACTLALTSTASAQNDIYWDGSRKFTLSGLEIADLALQGSFALVFLVLAAYCLLIMNRLQAHRYTFSSFFLCSLFFVLNNVLSVAFVATASNEDDFLYHPYKVGVAAVFFRLWAISTLYLSGALVLHDRASRIDDCQKKGGRVAFAILFTFSGIFIFDGTLTSIILAVSEYDVVAAVVFIVFLCLWAITAVCQSIVSGIIYKKAKKGGINDKILNTMLKVWTPLCLITMALGVLFTLLPFTLIANLILNIMFSAMISILVFLGMRPRYWQYSGV